MGTGARSAQRFQDSLLVCIAVMPECGQVAVLNVVLSVEVSARCPVVLTRHTVVRRYIVHCPTTGHQFNNAANTCSVSQNFANAAFIIASKLKNSTQFTLFLIVVL
jgi:hypothetical protein